MKSHELIIEGMSCGHCVMSVSKELSKVAGLKVRNVELGRALVEYDDTEVTQAQLAKAIEEAGYRLVSA
ncbi:MAG: heavy-metal-associated domain-containing protein [Ignavibacteria bacterium]|nr:heavy-metal-associated domain-containing protein [Ignavibacteria bacterium]